MSTPGYHARPFTSLYCRTRVRFTICLKFQHSCRSLLAGTRRRRSPRRDPTLRSQLPRSDPNCSGVSDLGVIRSNVMLKALPYEPLPLSLPGVGVEFLVVAGPPSFGRRQSGHINGKVTLDGSRTPIDVLQANALWTSSGDRSQFVQWRKMYSLREPSGNTQL